MFDGDPAGDIAEMAIAEENIAEQNGMVRWSGGHGLDGQETKIAPVKEGF